MSRQAQNMILGGLAFAVGIVGMIAAFLVMNGDDGVTTAGAPLGPSVEADAAGDGTTADSIDSTIDSTADGSAAGSAAADESASEALTGTTPSTLQPLAVAPTPSSTTPLVTTSTAVSTTATPTTLATTTEAPATTAAPSSTAETETTMSDTTMSDTTMSDTTEAPSDGGGASSTEPQSSSTTPATQPDPTTTTIAEAPAPTDAPAGGLNAVEREIARLTNELRTNPNGPMRREGPVINCGGRIRVTNGQYDAIGALQVSEVASLQVARPWSVQMTRSNFNHRPNAGVGALQDAGISVRSAGENIAYHSYQEKAMTHFTGWRESDGHFCNMMDPGFTHIVVGEDTHGGISYAT
ncbi:MAG: CAP domain-containing protein, partial [Actinomycetota bacterium]